MNEWNDRQAPCSLCPRMCGVIRTSDRGGGFCGMGTDAVLARAALHHWEEPCISGVRGTGAVFFSGCTLGCAYCQNACISHENNGKTVTAQKLADIFKRLVEEEGAQTLSLITPTHFIPAILEALNRYRPKVPLVYNCGGYELVETVRVLNGAVDVWLPDFKHASAKLSALLAKAPDYPETALSAIREMCRQTSPAQYDDEGIMTRGTLIRHLVLPSCTGDSMNVLSIIREQMPQGTPVSLMGQYTPQPGCLIPGMDRKLTQKEYRRVVSFMQALELPGYIQTLDAADSGFIPAFDLTGLEQASAETGATGNRLP